MSALFGWDRVVFFVVSLIVLHFEFVTKTALTVHQCFSCWSGVHMLGLFLLLVLPCQPGAEWAQGAGEG